MFRDLRTSLSLFVLLMLLSGFAYPMFVLKAGGTLFPDQADGSMISDNGKIIGSSLIGQNFTGENYFYSRPSAAGNGYDASNSSGSNLAPTAPALAKAVADRVTELKKSGNPSPIPVDLVTASGSGLDPHISPAAARYQAARIAVARHLPATKIEELILHHTEPATFGFLGAARVNVLALNRALDQLPAPTP